MMAGIMAGIMAVIVAGSEARVLDGFVAMAAEAKALLPHKDYRGPNVTQPHLRRAGVLCLEDRNLASIQESRLLLSIFPKR